VKGTTATYLVGLRDVAFWLLHYEDSRMSRVYNVPLSAVLRKSSLGLLDVW
jgi:hypothetical protein